MIKIFNSFLFEMSNYDDNITGLKNIIIWIGPRPKTHGHRIKVSNDYYKMNKYNCFTITIPSLDVIGNCKLSFKELDNIKTFIKLNEQLIKDFSDYKISLEYLLKNIIKI